MWEQPWRMVRGVSVAARSWRSRSRTGMIRGGMGGLRGATLWIDKRPPGCPESLSCSRGDKVFSTRGLRLIFATFGPMSIYGLRDSAALLPQLPDISWDAANPWE